MLTRGDGKDGLKRLAAAEIPANEPAPPSDPAIAAVVDDVSAGRSERDGLPNTAKVKQASLDAAMAAAHAATVGFDAASRPVLQSAEKISALFRRLAEVAAAARRAAPAPGAQAGQSDLPTATSRAADLADDVLAARLRLTQKRYDRESKFNMAEAQLFEVQVRLSSLNSQRHQQRSRNFFYGALAAQAGVTIATLALAVRRKSILWALASIAGLIAVAVGVYVYVFL